MSHCKKQPKICNPKNSTKIAAMLVLVAILAFLPGCQQSLQTDEEGNIVVGELANKYADGIYIAYSQHLNPEGLGFAMQVTVKNGIINSVFFAYFDIDGQFIAEIKDEEANELATRTLISESERRHLYSMLIQNQKNTLTDDAQAAAFACYTDYMALLDTIMPRLPHGIDGQRAIGLAGTYSKVVASEANEEVFYTLAVDFTGEAETRIDFDAITTNSDGEAFLEEYFGEGYEEEKARLPGFGLYFGEDDEPDLSIEDEEALESIIEMREAYKEIASLVVKAHSLVELDIQLLFAER